MVSEHICLEILTYLHSQGSFQKTQNKTVNAVIDRQLYRELLRRYLLEDIDAAIRWLNYGQYIVFERRGGFGGMLSGIIFYALTDSGHEVAERGHFSAEERQLFYPQEDPYAVFVAHQFNKDDEDMVTYLREKILMPEGFKMLDGSADSLEAFRGEILRKIRESRFFLCLLTKRTELSTGTYASSVWLYQETGVAVACGKKPLLLVEKGVDTEYVGELQRIYEYIPFTRSNHPQVFPKITDRLVQDLRNKLIPPPKT